MDAGKSVKIALAKAGKTIGWLAIQMDVTPGNASRIANSKILSQKALEKLAKVFDMKTSEFIALSE